MSEWAAVLANAVDCQHRADIRDAMDDYETVGRAAMLLDSAAQLAQDRADNRHEMFAVPSLSSSQSRLVTAAQRRDRPAPEWTIEHVMAKYGVGQMFGESYVGKTFVALDLALSLANKVEVEAWHGNRINRAGPVVYALMEGAFDAQVRIDAWLAARPGATDADLFTLEEEALDLRDRGSLDALRQDITALGIEPVLVVVDTQSLATPGTDENSNPEMNLVMANLKELAKALNVFVLLVHHTGHEGTRARGASAQRAALDLEVKVEDGKLSVTKVKGYKPSGPYWFTLAESGASVWAKPTLDPERALWEALRAAGADGLTRAEATRVAWGETSDTALKRAERALKKWVDQEVATTDGKRPARYWAVAVAQLPT